MISRPLRVRTRINTAQKYYKYVIIKNRALASHSHFTSQQKYKYQLIKHLIVFYIKEKSINHIFTIKKHINEFNNNELIKHK